MPDYQYINLDGLHFTLFIEHSKILDKISEIADAINEDFTEKDPLFIVVLNGAFMFASDLMKRISIKTEIVFVRLKSYQGITSSGHLEEVIGLDVDLKNRSIVIIEDIVDSGNTMFNFTEDLKKKTPRSIAIASLLLKPSAIVRDIHVDYVGFEIANEFVVGYGLDYNGQGRNYPDIYQLADDKA